MSYLPGSFLVGEIKTYAGVTIPNGWLLCYGQAVSRTVYADLFNALTNNGTVFPYGSGDGSTTFNLPDLRGRTIAGKDDMGGTSALRIQSANCGITGTVLGANGGLDTMLNHTHGVGTLATGTESADHSHSGTTGIESASHYHNNNTWDGAGWYNVYGSNGGSGAGYNYNRSNTSNTGNVIDHTSTQSSNHTHSITTGGRSAAHTHAISGSTAAVGTGTTHGNMPPTIILNYIIKY